MKDNAQLRLLFDSDQSARRKMNVDWDIISLQDAERRTIVSNMLRKNRVKTGADYYHAAMIFQHDPNIKGIRRAKSLAQKSVQIGDKRALWLYAAATDRILMRENKRQKFGTQYLQTINIKNDNVIRKWVLYPVEKETTDAMRAQFNVLPLKELLRGAKKIQ